MVKSQFLKAVLLGLVFVATIGKAPLFAQINIRATLDTTAILIGDQIHLHLRAEGLSDTTGIKFDKTGIDTSAKVVWIKEFAWKPLSRNLLQKDLTFTVFDSGYYFLQPALLVLEKNGSLDSFYSNDLRLTVNNPDTVRLEDIKPIIEEPVLFSDYLPYFLGFGLVLIAALLVLYFSKRKKQVKTVEIKSPPKSAHEIAFEKLENLKTAQYWQRGEVKRYYSELTFILREYLESRFHFPALESTSDEILNDLKRTGMDSALLSTAHHIFQTADLVKFAKAQPAVETHPEVLEEAFSLVSATKMKEDLSQKEDL